LLHLLAAAYAPEAAPDECPLLRQLLGGKADLLRNEALRNRIGPAC
jgi:hypothetical protein